MMTAFSNLSTRERVLAMIVGGALFILANLLGVKVFFKQAATLRAQLSTQTLNWNAQEELLKQRDFWTERDNWLRSKQPRLTNEATASGQFLETIQKLAADHHVTLDSPAINELAKTASYQSISVTMQTTSSWADLIAFFAALQQPDQFIVPESAGVRIDPNDNTKMRAQLRIAKWYAL